MLEIIEPIQKRYSLKDRHVHLIDSGLGLLSVAYGIYKEFPQLRLTATADAQGFPWGTKTEDELIERTSELTHHAIEHLKAEAIVIACNTASTAVLEPLRKKYDMPIIGVVPAVKPAAQQTITGNIGILATEGTIQRPYVDQLIKEYAQDCRVIKKGSKNLAFMAEGKLQGKAIHLEEIEKELQIFMDHQVDFVALACTHYPLLLEEFRKITKEAIQFFDPSSAVAHQVARQLSAQKPKKYKDLPEENILYITGDPYHIEEKMLRTYGFHLQIRQ